MVLMAANPKNKSVHPSQKIRNTLVIYLENHSFFNLFSQFPGADNGVEKDYKGQINENSELYKSLPQVYNKQLKEPDSRFPKELPNAPFAIDQYIKQSDKTPDPIHEFYIHQLQINEGRNDKFVQYSGVGVLTMGYYDMKNTYLWKLAKEHVLADHFFQSAFGGSFLNHQWLIAARTPQYPNGPEDIKSKFKKDGSLEKAKALTEDFFAVNTIQPFYPPFDTAEKEVSKRLPPLDYDTIGDRLTEKKISWAWYAGGWKDILKGDNSGNFQFHHQPFVYFKKYAPDTPERKEHLKDEEDLITAIKSNQLPEVVFYKPVGDENAHPGYGDVTSGDAKVQKIIELLKNSKLWNTTLVIITFDEHGGFWDPKAPKKLDRWGLGSRIPAIFVSNLTKKSFVDHTPYETVSILSFLEKKYSLAPLTDRDKKANPLEGIWAH